MEIFIRDEEIEQKELDMEKHELNEIVLTKFIVDSIDFGNVIDNEEYCIDIKSLDQHDAEVRAEERKKVIDELLEWADSKMMGWINSPKYREPHFRGTRIIHYYDLQQKLNELKGE